MIFSFCFIARWHRSARNCPYALRPISIWGRYHGDRRPSSDDSFHSPTVIPPSALDKPSIMKRYHRRRTCSHTSPRRSPTMVKLHDTRFVECRWWNDGWTGENCRHLTVVGLHDTGPWSSRGRVAPLTVRCRPILSPLFSSSGGQHIIAATRCVMFSTSAS